MELVEAMAAAGLLQQHQLTPLLLGAANDAYAQVGSRIRAAYPSSRYCLNAPCYQADPCAFGTSRNAAAR